jgi:hypothetical protein
MNEPLLPDSQKIRKTVVKLRNVCRQFDVLNSILDEFIAQVEAEIRKNSLHSYRRQQIENIQEERV